MPRIFKYLIWFVMIPWIWIILCTYKAISYNPSIILWNLLYTVINLSCALKIINSIQFLHMIVLLLITFRFVMFILTKSSKHVFMILFWCFKVLTIYFTQQDELIYRTSFGYLYSFNLIVMSKHKCLNVFPFIDMHVSRIFLFYNISNKYSVYLVITNLGIIIFYDIRI